MPEWELNRVEIAFFQLYAYILTEMCMHMERD